MSAMFYDNAFFNQDIRNVSNVTNMKRMFESNPTNNLTVFNQPIGDWDVSNVTDMEAMFLANESFNQPIGN